MILLLGGTGMLGGQVLRKLQEREYQTRLAVRGTSDWKDVSISDLKRKGVELVIADVNDRTRMVKALEGVTTVINTIGSMTAAQTEDYHKLHVDALESLLEICGEGEVARFIHVSCLGATADSENEYLRSKYDSEELVRKSKFKWTIFKPSFLFGERFPFLDLLKPLVGMSMCMPIPGCGTNDLQPVFVDDVAECLALSVYDEETYEQTYELAGPEVMSLADLMSITRSELGLGGMTFNVSSDRAAKMASAISKFAPQAKINEDLVKLFLSSSVTSSNALGVKFPEESVALSDVLGDIISSYRDRH